MAEVVVLGAVAADVVLRVSALPRPGDQVAAESVGWRLGGSSANVAVGLRSGGHDVELIGPVGTDAVALELLAELERRGVRTDRCIRVSGPAPRALILLDGEGERTLIQVDRGTAADAFPVETLPDLTGADCVYVESYERFPTAVAEATPGALVVATPPPPGHMSWPADVIIGSEGQLLEPMRQTPFEALQVLAGPRLRWVVVTRGSRGADAFGPDSSHHAAGRQARQIDATGAGDAFAAGLLSALLLGRPIEEALETGAVQGASAVEVLQSVPAGWIDFDRARAGERMDSSQ